MKNKLKVVDVLGSVGQSAKGFIQQFTVLDFSGEKSVVKIFAKTLDLLPKKTGDEIVVDCNEFCFASK